MDFHQYIEEKKQIQSSILTFLDQSDTDEEEIFQNLINLIQDQKITENKDELTAFFHFITQISVSYYRKPNFQSKIDKIISIFENDIKNSYSNLEIFHIFKKSKLILLYLIQNNLLSINEIIIKILLKPKYRKLHYLHYFYPELKQYLTDEKLQKEVEKDVNKYKSDQFDRLRHEGENDQEICALIRSDNISDFTSHINRNKKLLFSTIPKSIFETNLLLAKTNPTLIEYAAYFGSIQIFNYLLANNCKHTPDLWLHAVHGRNLEVLQTLEEQRVRPKDYTYVQVLDEAYKAQFGEVTSYIIEKLVKFRTGEEIAVLAHSLKFYDFASFPGDDMNNPYVFCYLCHADYLPLLKEIVNLSKTNFEINAPIETVLNNLLVFIKFRGSSFLNTVSKIIEFFNAV